MTRDAIEATVIAATNKATATGRVTPEMLLTLAHKLKTTKESNG